LAAYFLFSSYAAAKPTTIKVSENGLSLETDLNRTTIPWTDIQSRNFVDELLFNSLKIKLKKIEMISIINFIWRGNNEIYGFLRSMNLHQADDQWKRIYTPVVK